MDVGAYSEQRNLDDAIDDLCCNMRLSRLELHISASGKGEVYGDLQVTYCNEVRDFSNYYTVSRETELS